MEQFKCQNIKLTKLASKIYMCCTLVCVLDYDRYNEIVLTVYKFLSIVLIATWAWMIHNWGKLGLKNWTWAVGLSYHMICQLGWTSLSCGVWVADTWHSRFNLWHLAILHGDDLWYLILSLILVLGWAWWSMMFIFIINFGPELG